MEMALVLLVLLCIALAVAFLVFAFRTLTLLGRLYDDSATKLATLADAKGMEPFLEKRRSQTRATPPADDGFVPVPDDNKPPIDDVWKSVRARA